MRICWQTAGTVTSGKMNVQLSELQKDTDRKQFFLSVDGHRAFVDYELDGERYRLTYSEVPTALRGRGIGRTLVESTFEAIAAEGRTAIAECSYVRHVATGTDRWEGVVVER